MQPDKAFELRDKVLITGSNQCPADVDANSLAVVFFFDLNRDIDSLG